MPITTEQFVRHYPRLYHMACAGSWESIRRYGLLSTTALLDLFGKTGAERRAIERSHRPESIVIKDGKLGAATIRDQKPMRESSLRLCLDGMSVEQWYVLLNGKVFFWVTAERVQTLLNARAYRDKTHTVITADTRELLARYLDRASLSPINSGSTIYNPRPRGRDTFRRLHEYPFEERRRMRGLCNAVAELAVDHSVLDIREFVVRVDHRRNSRVVEVVYRA